MYFKTFLSDGDLALAGAYWQKQLRLEDWEVKYSLRVCGALLGNGHSEGATRTLIKRKECLVTILRHDNCSYPEDYDMEQTLVHELLHLHFDPYFSNDEKSLTHIAQEQTIDQLAHAFVRLNRGIRR